MSSPWGLLLLSFLLFSVLLLSSFLRLPFFLSVKSRPWLFQLQQVLMGKRGGRNNQKSNMWKQINLFKPDFFGLLGLDFVEIRFLQLCLSHSEAKKCLHLGNGCLGLHEELSAEMASNCWLNFDRGLSLNVVGKWKSWRWSNVRKKKERKNLLSEIGFSQIFEKNWTNSVGCLLFSHKLLLRKIGSDVLLNLHGCHLLSRNSSKEQEVSGLSLNYTGFLHHQSVSFIF